MCGILVCAPEPATAQKVECVLRVQSDGRYLGPCTGFDEGRGTLDIRPSEPLVTTAVAAPVPMDVTWTGVLQIPRWPALRVDLVDAPYEPDAMLVMKSQVAWLLIEDPTADVYELQFWFQFDEDAPPTRQDLAILERAEEILNDERVWDRSANTRCGPAAVTWTLHCALHDATMEVVGEVHPMQPAWVILRDVIEGVFREAGFERPLVDYNTYDDAILVEMHRMLSSAQTRVRRDL